MNEDASDASPLAGLRVLDLATGAFGAIGRTLAELGADVVRIEAPGGGADRSAGPSLAGVGLAFAAASLGKRAAALDLGSADDRETFEALAARADILIESTRPGSVKAGILDIGALRRRFPELVILSIRDFGAGAFAAWRAPDGVLQALSGELWRSGVPGREPLLPPGELAVQSAAAQGVYGLLVAYLHRLQSGEGDHLELSLLEATAQTLDPGYGIGGSATAGTPAGTLPRTRPDARHQYPIFRCKDGYVRFCVLAARQWQGLFDWMGRPAEFADPAFNNMRHRFASTALSPAIAAFVADKTQAEIEAAAERHRFPAGGVLTLEQALESEQIRACNAVAQVEIAPGVHASFPNGVIEIDGRRAGIRGAPPALRRESEAVLADWSGSSANLSAEPAAAQGAGRPLAGLRVLDLGVIVVGAEHGRLLADYGAEVIKVENAAFPDGSRAASAETMPSTFAAGHRNKLGLGLNLRDPEGRELLLKLVALADVVLSNFRPGTLESLGLGPDVLLARNPGLIVASSSAFGPGGPWSGRLGYGPLVRASAGLSGAWRYPDAPDSFSDAITIYPDHVAARLGIAGVLALLIRRLRTGRGGRISVSQTEVMLNHMAEHVAAASLSARGVTLEGGPFRDTPYGVFPCAGDDEWCVVAVTGDEDWRALCRVLRREDLADQEALSSAAGRAANRDLIHSAVAAWTAALPPQDAMRRLQDGGVPAGAMLRVAELPAFEFFEERGFFHELHQPQVAGPILVDNAPIRAERLAPPPLRPAPLMGEHSATIARSLLGLDENEIDRLFAAGVLEGARRSCKETGR